MLSSCNTGFEEQHVPSCSLLKEDSYNKTKILQIKHVSTATETWTSSVWFHTSQVTPFEEKGAPLARVLRLSLQPLDTLGVILHCWSSLLSFSPVRGIE